MSIVKFPAARPAAKVPTRADWLLEALAHMPPDKQRAMLHRAQHVLRMIDKNDAELVRAFLFRDEGA